MDNPHRIREDLQLEVRVEPDGDALVVRAFRSIDMSNAMMIARDVGRPTGGARFDVLYDDALDRAIQAFHPDVEFHEDLKFPEATVYRGRDALRAYFRQFSGEFDRFWFEAEDILDAGDDQVLLLTHVHGR